MKIIGTFCVVVTASIALLQPAQGRSRGSAPSFSSAPHFSRSAGNFSSRPRNFSRSAPRFNSTAARFSSQAAFRNRIVSGPRQLAVSRTSALRPQGFNSHTGVIALHSANRHPNWDRNRDHFWHGHRCHWHHNSWVIFDLGFFPWAYYGYGYPYGAYSYYDDGAYDDGYARNDYSQSEYDNPDSSVSQVQAALARKGYYHGAIDGSFGPATRNALRRYQRNQGMDVTGRIDQPVVEALRLR